MKSLGNFKLLVLYVVMGLFALCNGRNIGSALPGPIHSAVPTMSFAEKQFTLKRISAQLAYLADEAYTGSSGMAALNRAGFARSSNFQESGATVNEIGAVPRFDKWAQSETGSPLDDIGKVVPQENSVARVGRLRPLAARASVSKLSPLDMTHL